MSKPRKPRQPTDSVPEILPLHETHSRVILVTGIKKDGTGEAICRRLTLDGHRVVVLERDKTGQEAAEEIRAAGGNILFLRGNADDEKCVAKLMGTIQCRFGRLDAVICNAGSAGHSPGKDNILDTDTARSRELWQANFESARVVTRAALTSFFLPQREGRASPPISATTTLSNRPSVIYFGTTTGQAGDPGQLAYGAAKCGLSALNRHLAAEYGRTVRSFLLRPGTVETNSANWQERRAKHPQYAQIEAEKTPIGMLAKPDNIAALVLFLLRPEADFLVGQELTCDGGVSATGVILPEGASSSRDAFVDLVVRLKQQGKAVA